MVDRAFYEARMAAGTATTSTTGQQGQNDPSTGQGGKADVGGELVALLPPAFVPTKWDVICQRGKECFEHGKLVCFCWMPSIVNEWQWLVWLDSHNLFARLGN